MEEVRIPVGEGAVTASVHGAGPTVVILGHGAGSDRRHPRLLELAEVLSASGRGAGDQLDLALRTPPGNRLSGLYHYLCPRCDPPGARHRCAHDPQ